MTMFLIALAIGAAAAALVFFGVLKGLKILIVLAVLTVLIFLGYIWFVPGATQTSGPTLFRGPINIHIIPPQDTSQQMEDKLRATAENTAKEYFQGDSVRDPFQALRGN